jgi:hypothetical protein
MRELNLLEKVYERFFYEKSVGALIYQKVYERHFSKKCTRAFFLKNRSLQH